MMVLIQLLTVLYWVVLFALLAIGVKFAIDNREKSSEEILYNLGNFAKFKLALIVAFILIIFLRNWIYSHV